MLTVAYDTDDLSQAAQYTVRISALKGGVDTGVFLEYRVDYHDPCTDVAPAIDPTILLEADLIYEYELFQGDYTETLDDTKVTSPETTATCPSIMALELLCGDGSGVYDVCNPWLANYFSLSAVLSQILTFTTYEVNNTSN